MSRPSWDDYFMTVARTVANRSTCDRAHVGVVLVRERRILATGYSGSPSGLPHCDDVGHLLVDGHCVRTVHAEANAIIQAALHGVSTRGATCYVTHFPCLGCTKMLINAGVSRIVYGVAYRRACHAAEFLAAAGIQVSQQPGPPLPDEEDGLPIRPT